jgi:hypothetical protein
MTILYEVPADKRLCPNNYLTSGIARVFEVR